ncbi:hypothetical protein JX266_005273 [Neoarthrinium moseri]|uniref:uncharacterized protein n=1 Tax=Neoarthrinium moseri TaxID=1658444 RepID=UPI001FDD17B3|nr:uncharacterized protein JN550_007349 [Neoarthrinium moseri]KAI1848845.1 hypothetical protein JX266_005273 [Neoarthrinium moseri]KAI1866802.1 hypothetical protein JN550_007349 [Neoarthrinium moseri]
MSPDTSKIVTPTHAASGIAVARSQPDSATTTVTSDVSTGNEACGSMRGRTLERALNRKLDIALLPLLAVLYLFNGLDRGNIGNAQTQGFTDDIGAAPDDLNLAVSMFFITFILFQPPSAAFGRWDLALGADSIIRGFEAGFYPTAVAYLSSFYPRFDIAVRLAVFYGQYAVAGAFSGSIAYAVFHIQNGFMVDWQYLFIIEGAATCVFALIAWCWLPAGPGTAWVLGKDEQIHAVTRIHFENALYVEHEYARNGIERDRLSRRDVVETMKDWKLWYVLVCNICTSVPNQAFSVFLPLVVQGLGYSSIQANLMSVPPYVCGAVGLYSFALSSDRRMERGYHIVIGILIGMIGLVTVFLANSSRAKYAGLCVFLFGSYISTPLTAAWLIDNTPEPGKRSLVLGMNGFGNLAGVIGAQIFRREYAPDYQLPFRITLGFVAAALAGYLSYRSTLASMNRGRARIRQLKTSSEVDRERTDPTRYADKKWTFTYGL